MQTEQPELSFDDIYMAPPEDRKEFHQMRADSTILLSAQAEEFCRLIIWSGKTPTIAYEMAFAIEVTEYDEDDHALPAEKKWVKPDHASYLASKLLKQREIVDRIKEMRDEILLAGGVSRDQVLLAMKGVMLDEGNKNSDRIQAAALLAKLEGFNKEAEAPSAGAHLTLILPFVPQQLTSAPAPKLIDGEVIDIRP